MYKAIMMFPTKLKTPKWTNKHRCTEYISVQDGHGPLVGEPELMCPSLMEEVPLFPLSCVAEPPGVDPHQLSFEDSSSDRVGDGLQDTTSGPRNLRTKRIKALWLNRLEDWGPISVKHHGKQKRKKMGSVKVSGGCDKCVPHPSQRKGKRERVIDDAPHIHRIPQRRAIL